jgi:tryptophan synthase alpha chain
MPGVTPADCFDCSPAFRARHPDVPVGILTYANLVLARGRDAFYRAAAEAGVDSVLVADVPLFEAAPFLAAARAAGVAPVLIAAPNTPPATARADRRRKARAIPIASPGRGHRRRRRGALRRP